MELRIEYIDPEKLTPYANNAKQHPDEQVEHIANSIREFGFRQPIVVDADNVVVIGHGRLLAAKKLGLETVPVVRADDLTEAQVKALRLADNKTNESGWDFTALEADLDELHLDFDMSDFGFDIPGWVSDTEPADEGDDFDVDAPVEAKAKRGDIYQLGRHRLMCGDSTDSETVCRLMDGVSTRLLLTDPPYGIKAVESGGHNDGKKAGNQICRDNVYAPIIGDDTTDTARRSYKAALAYTENQIIFGGNYFTDFLPPSRCWIVWDKEIPLDSFADGELAWTSFDKNLKIYKYMWSGMGREGDRTIEGKKRVHPTQKPVGMIAEIIKDFSEENDSICDLFGGSGSTLIACEQLNRKCFMMELDPHYVDVIIARWEQFTGQKAVLLKG